MADNYTDLNLQNAKPIEVSSPSQDLGIRRPSWDESDDSDAGKKKKAGWAAMNGIQKGGVIGYIVIFITSLFLFTGKTQTYVGVFGWSWGVMGYVAGSLWRVRHAVHFWWAMVVALIVHIPCLPLYAYMVNWLNNYHGHSGRGIIELTGGLLAIEVLSLIFLLKHGAMWIHSKVHGKFDRGQFMDGN